MLKKFFLNAVSPKNSFSYILPKYFSNKFSIWNSFPIGEIPEELKFNRPYCKLF